MRRNWHIIGVTAVLFACAVFSGIHAAGRRVYQFGPTVSDANQVADETIDTNAIVDAAVSAAKIAADAVVTSKIADANITTAKLVDDAITAAKIADANVLSAALANDAVITAKIADANVTAAKLADQAVELAKMVDGNNVGDMLWWTGADWQFFDANSPGDILVLNDSNQPYWDSQATVDGDAIVDEAVTAAKIADANILSIALANDAVITSKIADANVTAAKLADQAVELAKMVDGNNIGDMLWWTGTDWQFFDANEPNEILTLNDSNQPGWQKNVNLQPGGSIGPGNSDPAKPKVKFTTVDLIAMLGDVGVVIGAEASSSGTMLTIVETTEGGDVIVEYIADQNDDNADRWRHRFANSGNAYLEHFADGSWIAAQAWTADSNEALRFNMADPDALYALDAEYCLLPFGFEDAVTITRVRVTLDADPTTELDIDLMFADAFIGMATPIKIADLVTDVGVVTVTSFNDATVPADKAMYVKFMADPDDNITQACIEIEFKRD